MFNFLRKKTDTEKEMEEYSSQPSAQYNTEVMYNSGFSMTVLDVFSITGRGTVVTGKIEQGEIQIGDKVNIVDMSGNVKVQTSISGIEMFRKILNSAKTGDNVGLLLSGINRSSVSSGDIIKKTDA